MRVDFYKNYKGFSSMGKEIPLKFGKLEEITITPQLVDFAHEWGYKIKKAFIEHSHAANIRENCMDFNSYRCFITCEVEKI